LGDEDEDSDLDSNDQGTLQQHIGSEACSGRKESDISDLDLAMAISACWSNHLECEACNIFRRALTVACSHALCR
jgi:hypothetical protein